MDLDNQFMQRAIELAELGRGHVSPNPMVGCVIVHGTKIIGEGYHEFYGGPHAEPNAIASVRHKELLPESTAYVSLEPCAHWGKTPPCANLLVKERIKKVVIGALDSNPLVGGKGINILKTGGVEVISGILESKVRSQNTRFFTFMEKKRPYIILKWAQTLDNFIARENYDSKWISNVYSRQLVHKWRTQEDGIIVGTQTAKFDNPRLNVRDWNGRNPLRIVIDRSLKLDSHLYIFDQSQPTLCYNEIKSQVSHHLEWVKLQEGFNIEDILKDLYDRKIQSIIVEGGAKLLHQFISLGLWDEARVFTGNQEFGKGISAPNINGKIKEELNIQGDLLRIISPL